jgi:hypothetical protein
MPITVLVVLVLQHNEKTEWVAALLTRERGDAPAAEAGPSRRTRRPPRCRAISRVPSPE